ncbi:MAG TPA: hypothetical protein VII63_08165 [Caulobacteraceae bacterium]
MSDKAGPGATPYERLGDVERIERSLARAVSAALLQHKRAGNPICEWRDGEVVWIAAADIPEPQDEGPARA